MLTHISNNYLGSTVHSSLTAALVDEGVEEQFVYSPLQKAFVANPAIIEVDSVKVVAPRIFNQLIRYFPLFKVIFSYYNFIQILKNKKVKPTFIIAHNLWSDGMIAWLYKVFYKVDYVVAIRNTDINHFIPKLPHYRWLISRVLRSSKAVVFINSSYLPRIKQDFNNLYRSISNSKVIYNGIDSEWFNLSNKVTNQLRPLQVCYVGTFSKGKNLESSVAALFELKARGCDIQFVAVGGDINEFKKVANLKLIPEWITVVNRTADKGDIAAHLRNSRVFLMPSLKETFGLVYIEALSQGCCIVHSKREGIDGVFNSPYIKGVEPNSIADIAEKTQLLLNSFPEGIPKLEVEVLISSFSWTNIAKQYLEFINTNKL